MAMFPVVWKHSKMHQNTFLTTLDVEKYLFYDHVSGGLEACALRIAFFDAFAHCANASKNVFNHSRCANETLKISFFWWSGSMRKCIKTRFQPLQTLKISLLWPCFWWSGRMRKCIKTRF